MKTIFVAFVGVLVPMLILDSIWLSTMVKSFYGKYIGELLAPAPYLTPAILFYILYTLGVVSFVVFPALSGDFGLLKTFAFGAFFGLVAYGTYDLTNQATLKIWSPIVTIVDLIWGASLTGVAATFAIYITRLWN